jgi:FK506-binding protein 4/5
MFRIVSSPDREWHHEWKLKTKQTIRLPTDQLLGALNEHLEERRKGNDLYRQKKFSEALKQYERALGIVELVVGMSGYDQKEIDKNRISCYLNIAAVHIAQKNVGACISFCDKAVDLDATNVKALLRRAKAHTMRHEYQKAMGDLERVKDIEPWNEEAEHELQRLKQVMQKGREEQKRLYANMFQH